MTSVLCGFAALTAASALASPGWSAPIRFPLKTVGTSLSIPQVSYQDGGTATVAYVQVVRDSSPYSTVLHVGTLAPGGTYREELKVPSTAAKVPATVSLSVAPDGAAVVAWSDITDTLTAPVEEYASYRPAGSRKWGKSAEIASNGTYNSSFSPKLVTAIAANGIAAAGVQHQDSTIPSPYGYRIDVAVHGSKGNWGASTQISPPSDDAQALNLGFDADGDLTAAFIERTGSSTTTLGVVERPSGSGVWGSFQDLLNSKYASNAYDPILGIAPNGSAVIAFQYANGGDATDDVNAVTRVGANGEWSSPADLTPGADSSSPVGAGVSPSGKAYVLYKFTSAVTSDDDCVGAVRAQVGGTFTAANCVSPLGFEESPGTETNGVSFLGNNAYFGWSGFALGTTDAVAQGSSWPSAAATPDGSTNLSAPTLALGVDAFEPDDDGGIVAFWEGENTPLMAAAFDAGGPNLVSHKVPTKATATKKIKLSAKFVDLWSGPAKVSWSFGDNGKASGASVSHTYKKAGTFTVKVTATDQLGNKTTKAFKIKVAKLKHKK